MLVFGIGEKAELARLSVLDLCEGVDFLIGVAVYGSLILQS